MSGISFKWPNHKEARPNNYPYEDPLKMPIASNTVLGGIKVGAGLNINAEGVLNSTGSGGVADSINWSNILNKPTAYKPEAHSHNEYGSIANVNQNTSKITNIENQIIPAINTQLTNMIH